MTIYFESETKYTIEDLGLDRLLIKSVALVDSTPELRNIITEGTVPRIILSGEVISLLNQEVGALFSGKTDFSNTVSGYRLGIDTDEIVKFYVGNSTNYLNWNGSTLVIAGALTATSGTIGGLSIGSTTLTGGNTILDSSGKLTLGTSNDVAIFSSADAMYRLWVGHATTASAPFSVTKAGAVTASNLTITGGSITIGSNATIDSSGNATFIGVSSLNKKAYTNFESSGRFVGAVGGSGLNTFGNQGVTIAPGVTGGSYSILQWRIGNALANNPTFTCTIEALGLVAASGSSRCFVGMGQPTVSGTGISYTAISHIGFTINKESGVINVGGQNGDASAAVGANFTTIVDTDIIELFAKVTATSVKYYYRKNGGAITLGTTQTTNIPTGTGEDSILFATSNASTAFNCQLIIQCAAYEH